MPRTRGYVCPVSPTQRYCKKVLVSEAEVRRRCTRRFRTVKKGEVLKTYCRTKTRGPRGGRTLLLSIRKPKR